MGGQIDIFGKTPNSLKYLIDTCSLLTQKSDDKHPRIIHKTMWEDIDELIREGEIGISGENLREIEDDDIKQKVLNLQPVIIDVNESIQINVRDIVNRCPNLIDFSKMKSSADAFLIATAMEYNLVIITEESGNSPKKIPMVANLFGIKSINILKLCEYNGWSY